MNLLRLRYFLAVVEFGTVTAAADELHVAQPALSRQLKTLEQELGVRLFSHVSNRLVLTKAGSAFVPHAHRLLHHESQTWLALEEITSGAISQVTIAATPHTARGLVAPFVRDHGSDTPVILCHERGHFDLLGSLHRDADLIITPVAPPEDYAQLALVPAPIYACVPSTHSWAIAGRSSVRLEELLDERIIAHSESSMSRQLLNAAFAELGQAPKELIDCDSGDTALALAARGLGVVTTTMLPDFGVYRARITRTASTDGNSAETLGVRLFATWLPDHFAAEQITSIAEHLVEYSGRINA